MVRIERPKKFDVKKMKPAIKGLLKRCFSMATVFSYDGGFVYDDPERFTFGCKD